MSFLFKTPDVPAAQAAPTPPTGPTEEEKRQALEKEKALARRAKGRRSTILTSGLGVQQQPNINRKTLLGQ